MKIHTKLSLTELGFALVAAKRAGLVNDSIDFVRSDSVGSRSAPHAFDVALGTRDKHTLPYGYVDQNGHRMNVRRPLNPGVKYAYRGAVPRQLYGGTWHEWGAFIEEIFALDPAASVGPYKTYADFREKTGGQFCQQG